MRSIMPRNSPIPLRITQNVTTAEDYQSSMVLRIYEGQRAIADKNTLLGELELSGIRPALKGEVLVEVAFGYSVRPCQAQVIF